MRPASVRYTSFRFFLRETLLERCQRNPAYSLRAFAKALQIEPTSLSQIMAGKRALPRSFLHKAGKLLKLSSEQLAHFESGIEKSRYRVIQCDSADENPFPTWKEMAMLEMIKLEDFTPSAKWIAARTGLPINEVERSIERLFDLGFIKISRHGRWRVGSERFEVLGPPSQKYMSAQVTDNLRAALKSRPSNPITGDRYGDFSVLSIARARLPEVKSILRKCRIALTKAADNDGGPYDEVYSFHSIFFPFTIPRPQSKK